VLRPNSQLQTICASRQQHMLEQAAACAPIPRMEFSASLPIARHTGAARESCFRSERPARARQARYCRAASSLFKTLSHDCLKHSSAARPPSRVAPAPHSR
jgi:hypothetical protein